METFRPSMFFICALLMYSTKWMFRLWGPALHYIWWARLWLPRKMYLHNSRYRWFISGRLGSGIHDNGWQFAVETIHNHSHELRIYLCPWESKLKSLWPYVFRLHFIIVVAQVTWLITAYHVTCLPKNIFLTWRSYCKKASNRVIQNSTDDRVTRCSKPRRHPKHLRLHYALCWNAIEDNGDYASFLIKE